MTIKNEIDGTTFSSTPQLIAKRQAALGLSDMEVANGIGYEKANVIALIKSGSMRLPVNKVARVAEVLQVDPSLVLRLTLSEQSPELMAVVEEVFDPFRLTATEANLIRHLRQLMVGRDAKPIVLPGVGIIALIAA